MVVALHAGFLGDISSLGQYLTVNGIFRIAVPIFLIINGYYFYSVLLANNQANWLKRVLVLYFFWMVFYSYFWLTVPGGAVNEIFKFIKTIIIGYHHLWYISGMIGAAIILITLRRFSSFTLFISIISTFLGGVIVQYMGNYHVLEGSVFDKLFNYNWFHRNMLLFSYPFFCIGYLINKHSLHKFISFKSACILSVLGVIILLGESYINYFQAGRYGGFDNYLSLILVCPFIFILFMKSNISGTNKSIALYSSAVYFIHSAILSILRKYSNFDETYLTILTIPASVLASYFIIKINKKLKFIL